MLKKNRRNFIKLLTIGAGSIVITSCGVKDLFNAMPHSSNNLVYPPEFGSTPASPVAHLLLTARESKLQVLPNGQPTRVYRYQSEVLEGDATVVQQGLETGWLGPVLRVKKGDRIKVTFKNELSQPTIIHWHGLSVPDVMDGHPHLAIEPGGVYEYDFTVINRAGTYWFHPHPHGLTGPQVYYGLAGLFIVSDEEEQALALPSGEFDVPLVLQDRLFDDQGQLMYMTDSMADGMNGFVGDTIFVNGQLASQPVTMKAGVYRLRLLNGSNSRIYKLAFSDGRPLVVIGSDGGLLEKPVTREYITLAPAERAELWLDLSADSQGDPLKLVSLPFEFPYEPMMASMHGLPALPQGAAFDVLNIAFGAEAETAGMVLPSAPVPLAGYVLADAVNAAEPRDFTIAMSGMIHTINGKVFEMEEVADFEKVKLGDLEVWQFINEDAGAEGGDNGMGMMMGSGMGGAMPHPMHLHGVQFQVVDRQVPLEARAFYDQLAGGFLDEGWKDTFLLMPGERAKVLVKFKDFKGMYLYHCHNLEHEDAGFMRNFRIE